MTFEIKLSKSQIWTSGVSEYRPRYRYENDVTTSFGTFYQNRIDEILQFPSEYFMPKWRLFKVKNLG